MTASPFSRPGAIDLSALKRPATPPPPPRGPSGGGPAEGGAYAVDVDEQNFQAMLESSMTAPVVLVVYSPSRMPASATLADDLETIAGEMEGRFLLGRIDVDAQPSIAQAMQVQSVPLVAMVLQGRLAPLLQDAPPLAELRTLMGQVLQQMAAQGMAGRHAPLTGSGPVAAEEEAVDPRYAPAEEAMLAGRFEEAAAAYQKLLDANPADAEAAHGLTMARFVQRTSGVDHIAARRAATAAPDDVAAQIVVADLDLSSGRVEDAFTRLLDLVRRASGPDRDQARLHLIELFGIVGNEDPRVLKGRRDLASALF